MNPETIFDYAFPTLILIMGFSAVLVMLLLSVLLFQMIWGVI